MFISGDKLWDKGVGNHVLSLRSGAATKLNSERISNRSIHAGAKSISNFKMADVSAVQFRLLISSGAVNW